MNPLALAEELAADGVVLLRNEGAVLPLRTGQEIVLLGFTSYHPHRMGWGSGDMLAHEPVPYDRGLEAAGVRLEPTFAAFYREELRKRQRTRVYERLNRDWWKWTSRFAEPDRADRLFDRLDTGIDRTLTCLVTIGRNAGETGDLKDKDGSFRLHREERRLLANACRAFENVVVLLNTCGVIDTSFMDEFPIKGLVHTSLLGQASGTAVANVLTGRVTPSGKTVDTWAKRYADYSTTRYFGTLEVPYDEGSFIGYRHFDHAEIAPRYPFGFGLSYTTFTLETRSVDVRDSRVTVTVDVRNTGPVSGREVVQVYLARCGRDTGEEPVKVLCAFGKTETLASGGLSSLALSFDCLDSAVYDEREAAWVLAEGDYWILVGDSSASLVVAKTIQLPRLVRRIARHVVPVSPKAAALAEQLTDDELVSLANGRFFGARAVFLSGGTGVGGATEGAVRCEAGEFWSSPARGIPVVTCADGPSGVRLANFGDSPDRYHPQAARLTAWPCATVLAQGWDCRAAERFGRAVAEEMASVGIDVWLAPGVNIHRNPLCGRNFEYFSEDPLLAGRMGAAVVRGVQTKADGSPSGRAATVKHFCTNNQEAHRNEQMNMVSEKTLREIYLKPFEIIVKEAKPLVVMTSYNQLNDTFCASNPWLLTTVLREEWGFDGLVLTDWWTISNKRRHPAAGNNIVMPGLALEWDDLRAALKSGAVSRDDLRRSAGRVLTVIDRLKSLSPIPTIEKETP